MERRVPSGAWSRWLRLVSRLVPAEARRDWLEEWGGEVAARGGTMSHVWGAVSDAWYLRTEGWTMDGMLRDVRTALRGFVRRPLFTALAGLTLAVGIGANTAIYSVVDAVLVDPLPFDDPGRLVSYNHEAPGLGVNVPVIPHSQAMYVHYRDNARALASFAVMEQANVNLTEGEQPERVSALRVSATYFDVLGVSPVLGRGLVEGEDREGAERVVVLGYGLWQQTFGGDPDVLGRLVEIDGIRRRVVGVMPDELAALDEALWLPLSIPLEPDAGSLGLIGIGRLADGATVAEADAEMNDLLLRFAEANPDDFGTGMIEDSGLTSDVKPLRDLLVQDVRPVLWVLLGTVGIVLLVACANVANLFVVRAEGRVRERALRTAMGASRLDIVRQALTESLTLAVAAGGVGLGIALLGVQGLLRMIPADLPQIVDLELDGSVLLFTAAISLASGVLFGIVPTLGYGRGDLTGSLKDGGRTATGGRERLRLRSVLVVAQVAMALVLLVGSGLMVRSFSALRAVDVGFASEGRLTFQIGLPEAEYGEPERALDFYRRLTERLAGLPGATGVGAINGLPLGGSKSTSPMEPSERPFPEGELAPLVEQRQVTPGYFAAMRIPLVEGRALEWGDQADELRAVVVSEALARAFWPGASAVGRNIQSQGADESWQVVGVAGDVRFDGVEEDPLPMVYFPVVRGTAAAPAAVGTMDVVVATGGDALASLQGAREALRAIDPRLPMISPRTVASIVEDSMATTSFTVVLLGIAAGIALLLGTVGIYGVIAYVVSRRTQEIGVRMALGAPAGVVLRSVVGQGMTLVAVGLALGLLGAWGLSAALASLLYGVTATDPLTFAATAGLLAGVSLLATWIPARRAAAIDPVRALRSD